MRPRATATLLAVLLAAAFEAKLGDDGKYSPPRDRDLAERPTAVSAVTLDGADRDDATPRAPVEFDQLPSFLDKYQRLLDLIEQRKPERALTLLDGIDDDFSRISMTARFTRNIADRYDPATAKSILERIDVSAFLGSSFAFSSIESLTARDPKAAADWAITLPSNYVGRTLSLICEEWARSKGDSGCEALSYLATIQDSANIDEALASLAQRNHDDPALIATMAASISDNAQRSLVYERMAIEAELAGRFRESLDWSLRSDEAKANPKLVEGVLRSWRKSKPDEVEDYMKSSRLAGPPSAASQPQPSD